MKFKLLILLCCLFIMACSKETVIDDTVWHISGEDIILCEDNTLVLGISQSEGIEKGISELEYSEVSSQLEILNLNIQKSISSLVRTKSSDSPSVQAYGVLIYTADSTSEESLSSYIGIVETDFAIECTFQSVSEWITHHFRVSGCVNEEITIDTGNRREDRFYGYRGSGPGVIQLGYHTDDNKTGVCIWTVIY